VTANTLSVNGRASTLVQEVVARADELNVEVSRSSAGATIIDMGQRVPGSWEAGRLYAEITMGGLAEISFARDEIDGRSLRSVVVSTSHPVEACWVSQKHADRRPGDPDDVILAGPAKALLKPADPSVVAAGYVETHHEAVAPLQLERPVTDDDISWIADACQIETEDVFVLVAPTPSLVCAIQVAARSVDNAMHRLHAAGVGLFEVEHLIGSAPVPPLADDALTALGRINDSLMYGTSVTAIVRHDGDLGEVAKLVTTQPRDTVARPFLEIFEAADRDFHEVSLEVFCIADIQLNDPSRGITTSAGERNLDLLRSSFFGAGSGP
jgi:methenyltetrahydromethanopterin cyclohydrolase